MSEAAYYRLLVEIVSRNESRQTESIAAAGLGL